MSEADKEVHCDEHGDTVATFVCRHLLQGFCCGFHEAHEADDDDPWPDAWCDRCNAVLERDGEWTDDNSPELGLLCIHCYESARQRNRHIPEPIRPGQLSVSEDEYAQLSIAAFEWCTQKRDQASARWAFDKKENWYFDSEAATMRFYDDRGGAAVLADTRVVGSFSTRTNTWAWVWGNSAYSAEDRAKVDPLRVFGEVRGIQRLTDDYWEADETDAWEMAQLAAYVLGADTVYRAPYDHMHVFMLLTRFRMES